MVTKRDKNGLTSKRYFKWFMSRYEVFEFLKSIGVRCYCKWTNQKGIEGTTWDRLPSHPKLDAFWWGRSAGGPCLNLEKTYGLPLKNPHDALKDVLHHLGLDPNKFLLPPRRLSAIYPTGIDLENILHAISVGASQPEAQEVVQISNDFTLIGQAKMLNSGEFLEIYTRHGSLTQRDCVESGLMKHDGLKALEMLEAEVRDLLSVRLPAGCFSRVQEEPNSLVEEEPSIHIPPPKSSLRTLQEEYDAIEEILPEKESRLAALRRIVEEHQEKLKAEDDDVSYLRDRKEDLKEAIRILGRTTQRKRDSHACSPQQRPENPAVSGSEADTQD